MYVNTATHARFALPRLIGYLSILAFPISFILNVPDTVEEGVTLGFILAISVFGPMITLAWTRSGLSRRKHDRLFPDNTISPLEWSTEDKYFGPDGQETFETAIPNWPHPSPA